MAFNLASRQTLLIVSALFAGACNGAGEAADDAQHDAQRGPGNYGEDRIGYKGVALSGASALRGDQAANAAAGGAAVGGAATSAAPIASGSFGGGPGGTIGGGSIGLAPPVAMDAGVGYYDAGSFDAGMHDAALDAQLSDARVNDADAADAMDDATPDAASRNKERPPQEPTEILPENPFHVTGEQATATFAIDVDTGSYTLARGSIMAGHLPEPKSVRVEEFLNYFHFHYAQPEGETPFSVYTEVGVCPWNAERKLLLLGIQGQEVALKDQPPANLVFLIDVSGSMNDPAKLPLLKKGFRMLTSQLRAKDRVAIVTYAGREAVVLPSTPGDRKETILKAIDGLSAGGSTNGAGGIQKAYEIAQQNFMAHGNNRVILATDGDFNVGLSQTDQLKTFIASKRTSGVYLSVYGFGAAWNGGNYKDEVGEQLADNGDGIYFYIDGPDEARRAFLEGVSGSLLTVAKDVKVQVELNPQQFKGYRLIGYENRVLDNAAFGNDAVDGGELGAGLSVTALFELIPADAPGDVPTPIPGSVPQLASPASEQTESGDTFEPLSAELLVDVRLRYKLSRASTSTLVHSRYGQEIELEQPTAKFLFAAGVAELAMQLRRSQYLDVQRQGPLLDQLREAKALDRDGAIAQLIQLAAAAQKLTR